MLRCCPMADFLSERILDGLIIAFIVWAVGGLLRRPRAIIVNLWSARSGRSLERRITHIEGSLNRSNSDWQFSYAQEALLRVGLSAIIVINGVALFLFLCLGDLAVLLAHSPGLKTSSSYVKSLGIHSGFGFLGTMAMMSLLVFYIRKKYSLHMPNDRRSLKEQLDSLRSKQAGNAALRVSTPS